MNHQSLVIEEMKDLRLELELPKPTCYDDWLAQVFLLVESEVVEQRMKTGSRAKDVLHDMSAS